MKFEITQHRRAWNQTAEWVYEYARFLADNATACKLLSIEDFERELRAAYQHYLKPTCRHPRGKKDSVEIKSRGILYGEGSGRRIIGLDKYNSLSGSALTISVEKEDGAQ